MNNDNNSFNELYTLQSNIEVTFSRIIGPLSIMGVLDSFKTSHDEIKDLLITIVTWGASFIMKKNLDFIDSDLLLSVYERLDKLKEKFLFDTSLGDESELSDEVVIWMLEFMNLRKKLTERKTVN